METMDTTILYKPRPTAIPSRYSAKRTRHRVAFFCDAPKAERVRLLGDFNGWNFGATPMCQMPDGRWTTSLELPHGHHRYLFMVDGTPTLDPKAYGKTRGDAGEPVSLVAVS